MLGGFVLLTSEQLITLLSYLFADLRGDHVGVIDFYKQLLISQLSLSDSA